ncbi:unnamed protein product [Spirodela intermedia]|uniref:Uncharacterized protein n=1 Tax=Spirodela intermedia TaxID=51605 RepID=A0A7I8L6Z9_SPIIN|nr:unnamed protein product [Spirodela intermedia]
MDQLNLPKFKFKSFFIRDVGLNPHHPSLERKETLINKEINEVGRRIVSGGCHPAERKNGDFAALRRLSPDGEELDGGGARVGSFILRSAQQEEALHRIWYALRRWRLVSRRIVLFPTTACSSINRR